MSPLRSSLMLVPLLALSVSACGGEHTADAEDTADTAHPADTDDTGVCDPFDAAGCQAHVTEQMDPGADHAFTHTLNEQGDVLAVEDDSNEDCVVDESATYTYTFDEHGNPTSKRVEHDRDADGTVDGYHATDYAYTYEEAPDGSGLRVDCYVATDIKGDQNRACHLYDDQGRVVTTEKDFTVDGDIDERVTYTYDASDRTSTMDRVFEDGRPSWHVIYTYEEGC